eukprot:m.416412 g.416412  ORF g.416412 m.416412 type:complete len:398 (-) comp21279_c0_seq2:1033-2226(-)
MTGKVQYDEGFLVLESLAASRQRGFGEEFVPQVLAVHVDGEGLVRRPRHETRLVEQREHAHPLRLCHINHRLVVFVLDLAIAQPFELVNLLFLAQDLVVEVLLNLFVGKIDTELLKGIRFKDFEPRQVQESDKAVTLVRPAVDRCVDLLHKPAEHASVQELAKRIASVGGFSGGQSYLDRLTATRLDLAMQRAMHQGIFVHTQQLRRAHNVLLGFLGGGRGVAHVSKFHIAQLEQPDETPPQHALCVCANAEPCQCRRHLLKLCHVIHPVYGVAFASAQVDIVLARPQCCVADRGCHSRGHRGTSQQLVENVERAFALGGADQSGLLEQICVNVGTGDGAIAVEVQLGEFSKPRRVVVTQSFRVAKCFQHWACTQHLTVHANNAERYRKDCRVQRRM